ncbi:MAG: cytochrome c oxidase subunit 3 [bacterium]
MTGLPREKPLLPSGTLAMVFFLFSETMFFAGLISAYLVLRSGFEVWPPAGQPRLPVAATAFNTALLLASGLTMLRAAKRAARPFAADLRLWLGLTLALGGGFLLLQGYEWVRLLSFGLTTTSSVYGGTFYLLIGAHALHVLGALVFLAVVFAKTRPFSTAPKSHHLVKLAAMYWLFVVLLWPVLYGLVYF